ncbi:chorismate mutase [Idiomarina xiamenensis]|uniref:Bifunctional chorismate mutase/prephenate dehydratase n=1 Tax=Idiomarina xiamenensis 10-D-4 TaxID=740709 RepID=K2KB10_9GAMM|nr:chorismate mutase [Idiomarina xiamenensis]EKE83737.1 chorismate mutase [Idiomarina xiamenensis 10-D-4]
MSLVELRQQIESVDDCLLQQLAARRKLALAVANYKAQSDKHVRDVEREASLLLSLIEKGKALDLDAAYLTRLFHLIIEDSVLLQQAHLHPLGHHSHLSIAHLGSAGTYSHLAAQGYANRRQAAMQGISCDSFAEIVKQVELGHAELGILPIENSTSGSITDVYDLLRHTHLMIVAETYLDVDHHLLVKPGTEKADIRHVYAHPQALSQCSEQLDCLTSITCHSSSSSAHAMASIAASERNDVAAIGPGSAAALFQLEAIDHQLANQRDNQTRFILVSRHGCKVAAQLPAKTSLIMATHNQPGALVDALMILRQQNISMSKLESRPMPGNPWEELFYVDVLVHEQAPEWQQAYGQLKASTRFIKLLGCYPDERVKPTYVSSP